MSLINTERLDTSGLEMAEKQHVKVDGVILEPSRGHISLHATYIEKIFVVPGVFDHADQESVGISPIPKSRKIKKSKITDFSYTFSDSVS